jgi:uncharacterized protein (TIGR02246 family)
MTENQDLSENQDLTELQRLFDAVSHAWAQGDVDAFVQHYTEDATAILPGFRLADREAICSSMALAFDGPLHGTRRVHEIQDVRPLGDGAVIATTASATLLPGESVAPAARREWATWVLVRGGNVDWRIKAYHGSPEVSS